MTKPRRYAPDTPYLKRAGGFRMNSHHILSEFQKAGYKVTPTGPIPKGLEAQLRIGGVNVRINPGWVGGRRVQARCPHCDKWVCAGHLDQHIAGCQGTWKYRS